MGKFLSFPGTMYRNDPYWVPVLFGEKRDTFDPRKNPYFEHAEIQAFMALDKHTVKGRIAAILDYRWNENQEEKTAFFGFFESENDNITSSVLFNAVTEWAREKKVKRLVGPVGIGPWDIPGILASGGFDVLPAIFSTYNPEYYAPLFEKAGFKGRNEYLGFSFDLTGLVPDKMPLPEDHLKDSGLILRTLDSSSLTEEFRTLQKAFPEKESGFVSLSENERAYQISRIRDILIPELAFVIENNGHPAGYCLSFPDLNGPSRNDRIGLGRLRLNPHAFWKRNSTAVRLCELALTPELTGRGFEELLILSTCNAARNLGFIDLDFAPVPVDEKVLSGKLATIGGVRNRTWRTWEYDL
jgi:hypothetical protein